jgi:hypothetical protein
MATKHDLMAKLAKHIGSVNGIKGSELAFQLGIPGRQLRQLISDTIKEDGIAICGYPATGYFIAKSAEELQGTIDFHRSRAKHELSKARQLKHAALADLSGQLHLRT